MEKTALLVLIESVLGKGTITGKGNYSFKCPFCNHHKNKLEINLNTNSKKENLWNCWVCKTKGKSINLLFKKLKISNDKFDNLDLLIIPSRENIETQEIVKLPEEFIPLYNTQDTDRLTQIESRHALKFLKSRNITEDDIIKYNIGFCKTGKYEGRIIIPSYDSKGIINYFVARDYKEDSIRKYKNPPVSKNIIGFELYINWDAPIIIVEGMFDALTIKRNVIPLLGTIMQEKLMEKLVKSSVDRIYIALDLDARKDALKHAEKLISYGKEVYLVELDGKDPNEIGFKHFLDIIEQTEPLNFQSLLNKKLQLI